MSSPRNTTRRAALTALAAVPMAAGLPAAAHAAAEASALDQVYDRIARHREACAAVDVAAAAYGALAPGPEFDAAAHIAGERHYALIARANELIRTEPQTLAGCVALARYATGCEEWHAPDADWHLDLLATLANALERLGKVEA